ncbi:DUF1697 domain-containing protein [Paenibacillus hexagrammi]|uniref:DUF1697 domain-containing protein n=1 Tax=Paenibacillus hexagrammi TaxID=2908839 RepID=A0ABY3SI39_9BACL|nr:DUF1697 domain-containing protein [Paenibacillus sp. YPD9-1]UJF33626.1 DUF1697 domain-containing protein [Paenibacillus sp. YPD9-1]
MVYIALVRGINVGGNNKVKMAELKAMFERIGLSRVQTYIQSGNVLFESDEKEGPLCERIELAFKTTFGFEVSMILRTAAELESLIAHCPFTKEEISAAEAASDAESLYVTLLQQTPAEEAVQRLESYRTEGETYQVIDRDIYFLFHHSVRNSKLAGNMHKLGVPATTRNWKTISKLAGMARAMAEPKDE